MVLNIILRSNAKSFTENKMAKGQSNAILDCLQSLYHAEMEGVMRYLHYSFMIMGHNRIPIQKWFRDQANESMAHALALGEKMTALGGHPSMESVKVEETNNHSINALLTESLHFETVGLGLYKELVKLATDDGDIALEEMARDFVRLETEHLEEVQKMLHDPNKK
jgi:bacterioferritin